MRTQRHKRMRDGVRDQAFFMVDALIGMFLIAALAASLAIAVSAQRRGAQQTAGARAAISAVEAALNQLQMDGGAATPGVNITPLSDAAPPGWRWVRAEATVSSHHASVVGLARSGNERRGE